MGHGNFQAPQHSSQMTGMPVNNTPFSPQVRAPPVSFETAEPSDYEDVVVAAPTVQERDAMEIEVNARDQQLEVPSEESHAPIFDFLLQINIFCETSKDLDTNHFRLDIPETTKLFEYEVTGFPVGINRIIARKLFAGTISSATSLTHVKR